MRYIIILTILFVSCNPCKYVSKHPECFQADTVIKEREVIKHIKEFIVNDSIVRDTIPCDPITNTVYSTRTVYKTKTIHETDTIKVTEKTTKLNPINKELESKVIKLTDKVENKNKWLKRLSGGLVLLLLSLLIIIKFR